MSNKEGPETLKIRKETTLKEKISTADTVDTEISEKRRAKIRR